MKLVYLAFVSFLAAILGVSGCQTEAAAPGVTDDYVPGQQCADRDGDGFGPGCARGRDCDDDDPNVTTACFVCAHDEPGCPCTSEGARRACGKVETRIQQHLVCALGASTCASGVWGACIPDGRKVQSDGPERRALGLVMPIACIGNDCDPYCLQFPDTPDETLTRNGVVGTDAGVTLAPIDGGPRIFPNGPMPPHIQATLEDAGLMPDGGADALIYHELVPPAVATDPVAVKAPDIEIVPTDVYFLDHTVGDNEVLPFKDTLHEPGGSVDQIRAALPDAWFGVGHYQQYDRYPWNEGVSGVVAFQHGLSMTSDTGQVDAALDWTRGLFLDTQPGPRSWVPALFALATTSGLRSAMSYWVPPRSDWRTYDTAALSPCPAGSVGYPCFRPMSLPITILLTDTLSANGPGGQAAYGRGSNGISGAASWSSVTPTAVAGNASEATAYAIDPAKFAIYQGSTRTDGDANQTWHWGSFDDCEDGYFALARNAYFKFTVAARTWFHFDTMGSSFSGMSDAGTALYLYRRLPGGGTIGVACDMEGEFTTRGSDPTKVSAIDGVVDPGDYFLVVDGIYGSDGNYVLHVNAMPDGVSSGRPAAEPNYEEALAAYNAIGGKVIGVDLSGSSCDSGPRRFVQRNTGNALEKLGLDTGSVDSAGKPYLVPATPYGGGPCHAGDEPFSKRIADAVIGLRDQATKGRMDVSMVGIDADDAADFDGPPGRAAPITPINIDDATFIDSIAAVPSAESDAGCLQTLADRFVGCQRGTKVNFQVRFKVPAAVPVLDQEQIFTLVLRTLRNGASVLSETPVVIVVPSAITPVYGDAWFVRDYDASVCPKGTAPLWSFFTWNAATPADSHIDYEVAVAPSIGELDEAPFDLLRFTAPPGPGSLVGQPATARTRAGGPDTLNGGALVDPTLDLNDRPRSSKAMRLRAHLVASSNGLSSPTLRLWNQQISCAPAE